jgi:serine/threonine-protein kinase MRCK
MLYKIFACFFQNKNFVKIPKVGGIRKGWNKYQLLFYQTKILFYDFSLDKDRLYQPSLIIDLTNEHFNISSITQQDAIHAKKDDISSIFKVKNSLFFLFYY